jgi:hypothetical protein
MLQGLLHSEAAAEDKAPFHYQLFHTSATANL